MGKHPDPVQSTSETGDANTPVTIQAVGIFESEKAFLVELARVDKDIAELALEMADKEQQRNSVSQRFGMVTAGVLSLAGMALIAYVLLIKGFLASLGFGFSIVMLGALLRVVLTGELNDMSWIAQVLGKRPSDEEVSKR